MPNDRHRDQVAREIIIDAVRAEVRNSPVDLGEPNSFAGLIRVASAALQDRDAAPLSTVRLHSLTAMGILGPKSGYPDDDQCELLHGLVEQYCEVSDHESLWDLVAAFGCGWHREPGILDSGWDGLWDASFTYLVKRVLVICQSVYKSLIGNLRVQFPPGERPEPLLPQTANYIATMLVQPVAPLTAGSSFLVTAGEDDDPVYAGLSITTDAGRQTIPTGARAVYQCTNGEAGDESFGIGFVAGDVIRMVSSETVSNLQVWSDNGQTKKHEKKPTSGSQLEFLGQATLAVYACTCGRNDCAQRHRLSAWNPGARFGKLQHFLYNAIRGKMQSIKAKDFAQSLLGSHWAREGWGGGARLRFGEVIHRACLEDDCRARGDKNSIRYYMGDRCDRCGVGATAETPLATRERLIVVDTEQLMWEFREYWRCGGTNCKVPELEREGKTIVDPEIAIRKNARRCASCGDGFWPDAQPTEVGQHFIGSNTLLAGVRALESARRQQHCHACGEQGRIPYYCRVCELNARDSELPARPSWYFFSARPPGPPADAESEDEELR